MNNTPIQGTITPLCIADRICSIYLPAAYQANSESNSFPVLYLLGEDNLAPIIQLVENQHALPFILVGIATNKWEEDFSPWPAPALDNKPEHSFTGKAATFLTHLQILIKPYIDNNYRTRTSCVDTTIIGYSLAGLTTLYALYTTSFASQFACLSGSLWFPGWTTFCESPNKEFDSAVKLYLSLGNKEKNSHNPLMAQVDDCTQKTVASLSKQVAASHGSVFFEYNNGGHFTDIPLRIAKAILFFQGEK